MSIPYMPLYVGDYEADTAHLTIEEDGAYNRLLRLCWRSPGCQCPNDNEWLARRLRVNSETFERLFIPIIKEFFRTENGMIFSPRALLEYERINASHKKRVAAGRKGGLKSKPLKTNDLNASNAKAKPKQPEPEPKPDITTLLGAGEIRQMCDALGVTDETKSPGLLSLSEPINWLANGCDMKSDIIPTLQQIAARGKLITSWAYCRSAVFEARDRRLAPPPETNIVPMKGQQPERRKTNSEKMVEALARAANNE